MSNGEDDARPPGEVFGLLANETRLRIIQALGDESESGKFSPLSFSDLQEAVGVEDAGQFGYHLRKMEGHFLERTERGYLLRVPGIHVYQAVKTGIYADAADVGPFELDETCDECGGSLTVAYRDLRGVLSCGDCGTTVDRYPLAPGSFNPERPETLADALDARLRRDHVAFQFGRCPYCSGRVSSELSRTRELDEDMLDADEFAVLAHRSCERCHWFLTFALGAVLYQHPTVVTALYRQGVDATGLRLWSDEFDLETTVRSTDPWRIEARVDCRGASVTLVVDEQLNVREVLDPADAVLVGANPAD